MTEQLSHVGLSLAKMADFWEEQRDDELVTMWQERPSQLRRVASST